MEPMDGRRDRAVSHGCDRADRGYFYGLNQNKRHNDAFCAAYAQCMAWHGYGS